VGGDAARLMSERLEALGLRIERLALDPDAIRAPLLRLVRPILSRFGWQPKVSATKVRALLELARERAALWREAPLHANDEASAALAKAVAAAIAELEENVLSVERATVVNRRPMVSHAAWLRRMWEVVSRASRVGSAAPDDLELRAVAATDPVRLLPPLGLRAAGKGGQGEGDAEAGEADAVEPAEGEADTGRLVDLQLGAVDHLIAAAMDESELLGRRQRLLEAARQVLLETSAALPLDRGGVSERQAFLAREITRIDRLRAEGLDGEVRLLHQARQACDRGERDRLHAALVALSGASFTAGDGRMAGLADAAVQRLWGGRDPRDPAARRASLDASLGATFGEDVRRSVEEACRAGRERAEKTPSYVRNVATQLYDKDGARSFLVAALATGGRFEVGGPLSPVRVTEHETVVRAVRFPTRELVLLAAEGPEDIPDAVIEDPRMILLSLAAGRLLARRFVLEETRKRHRTELHGEMRVYVLDGSTSMIGSRSRMRDAVLLAELSTLKRRLETQSARVVLHYRYFDAELHPAREVRTPAAVLESIEDVVSTIRTGDTDIQKALLGSLEQIQAAQRSGMPLGQAQIVLVTDGDAPVDEAAITAARERVGAIPVGLSVIALGQENEALRALVARQRARGERAFYHFIDDETLQGLAADPESLDDGTALHLPPAPAGPPTAAELEKELGGLLEEMAQLSRTRDLESLESLGAHRAAMDEVGLDPAMEGEVERARAQAMMRDQRALAETYERWFPVPEDAKPAAAAPAAPAKTDVDAVLVVLGTVVEVLSVVGGSPLARMTDAIDLLERLLPDARLTPARYRAVLAEHLPRLRGALCEVHYATGRLRPSGAQSTSSMPVASS
jgi:hypothetical protein